MFLKIMQPGQPISFIDKLYTGIVDISNIRNIKIEILNIEGSPPPYKLYGIYKSDNFIEKKLYEKYLPGTTVSGKILGFDDLTDYLHLSIN